MKVDLDPERWHELPADHDLREHVAEMRESSTVNRLDFFETDDGWCVHVVHHTAGACDAVSATFLLSGNLSDTIAEIHSESEERIIWRSGLGAQVTIREHRP